MIRSRRSLTVFVFLILSLTLVACRPSRQERGGSNTRTQAASAQNSTARMDSLLLIEQKLVEVIDSMASLVESDHIRIRNLEEQLYQLRSGGQQRSVAMPPPAVLMNDPPPPPPRRSAPTYMPPAVQTPPPAPMPAPAQVQPPSSAMSEPPQPPPAIPPPTPVPPAAAPQTMVQPSITGPISFGERYESALAKFHHNDFAGSLRDFQRLATDDANGVRASNYLYWEGECYYAMKRYDDALQTFGAVLTEYPHAVKAPAAQFKIAECYERQNINQSARDAYERLLTDYPHSEFRDRAEARLKALKY
jgi:TolA-binding protein